MKRERRAKAPSADSLILLREISVQGASISMLTGMVVLLAGARSRLDREVIAGMVLGLAANARLDPALASSPILSESARRSIASAAEALATVLLRDTPPRDAAAANGNGPAAQENER